MPRLGHRCCTAVVASLLLLTSVPSQGVSRTSATEQIVVGEMRVIESEVLGEARTIRISVPDGYEDSDERCGVLYLIDGHSLFIQTVGSVLHLRGFLPLIVVGIDNPDETRTRDLTTPTEVDRLARPDATTSSDFRRFLVEELRPWVDSNYRTNSIHLLAGHSFGGLFTFETMLEQPQAFQGYLVLSPSLWWNDGALLARLHEVPTDHPMFESFAFFSRGDEDEQTLNQPFDAAVATLKTRAPSHFRWDARHFPGLDHWAVAHPAINAGLRSYVAPAVSAVDGASTLDELVSRYDALAGIYGEEIPLTSRPIVKAVETLYLTGKTEQAGAMLYSALDLLPRETIFYSYFGEGFEEFGFFDEAIALYEEGVKRFEGDETLGNFAEELKGRIESTRAEAAVADNSD